MSSSPVIYLFFNGVAVPDVLKGIQVATFEGTGDGMKYFVMPLIVRLMT